MKNLFDEYVNHPQLKKKINSTYFGSDLNKFIAEECRTDIVVNNIDCIINYYKQKEIRIIESKHDCEKLSKGQEILLHKLSKMGIKNIVFTGIIPTNQQKFTAFREMNLKW